MSFRQLMARGTSADVKEIVEAIVKNCGGWRKAELKYGIKRQTLANWAKGSPEHRQLFDFLERARKDLGLKESTAYRKAVKKPAASEPDSD